jgi:hypothetical protein
MDRVRTAEIRRWDVQEARAALAELSRSREGYAARERRVETRRSACQARGRRIRAHADDNCPSLAVQRAPLDGGASPRGDRCVGALG